MSPFTPRPGQLMSSDLVAFLDDQAFFASLGFAGVASKDGKLPAGPDRVVVVTMTGGPGLSADGMFDNCSAQFRIRGGQRDPDSTEGMAWALDGLFCPFNGFPAGLVGAQYVSRVQRVGGPPAFMMLDPAGRTHFTHNLVFTVARVATTV